MELETKFLNVSPSDVQNYSVLRLDAPGRHTVSARVPKGEAAEIVRRIETWPELVDQLEADLNAWIDMRDTLLAWAAESLTGGWSTHQVDANKKKADTIRERIAAIGAIMARAKGGSDA